MVRMQHPDPAAARQHLCPTHPCMGGGIAPHPVVIPCCCRHGCHQPCAAASAPQPAQVPLLVPGSGRLKAHRSTDHNPTTSSVLHLPASPPGSLTRLHRPAVPPGLRPVLLAVQSAVQGRHTGWYTSCLLSTCLLRDLKPPASS